VDRRARSRAGAPDADVGDTPTHESNLAAPRPAEEDPASGAEGYDVGADVAERAQARAGTAEARQLAAVGQPHGPPAKNRNQNYCCRAYHRLLW
jgi:hypothetical protein